MLYEVITSRRVLNQKASAVVMFIRQIALPEGFQAAETHRDDFIEQMGLIGVITSYSIHYTKLYDAKYSDG